MRFVCTLLIAILQNMKHKKKKQGEKRENMVKVSGQLSRTMTGLFSSN